VLSISSLHSEPVFSVFISVLSSSPCLNLRMGISHTNYRPKLCTYFVSHPSQNPCNSTNSIRWQVQILKVTWRFWEKTPETSFAVFVITLLLDRLLNCWLFILCRTEFHENTLTREIISNDRDCGHQLKNKKSIWEQLNPHLHVRKPWRFTLSLSLGIFELFNRFHFTCLHTHKLSIIPIYLPNTMQL